MHVTTQHSSGIWNALLGASLALVISTTGLAQTPAATPAQTPAAENAQAPVKPADVPKVLSEEEKAEARKVARAERAREGEKERVERERRCVIKPVMSDAEITYCKEVRRGKK